jgi:hypothetical protein
MTPKIEKLIECVKYFASSEDNQVRPTSRPVSLKEAKGELLSLAQQAEDWKHSASAHDRSRNGRAAKAAN